MWILQCREWRRHAAWGHLQYGERRGDISVSTGQLDEPVRVRTLQDKAERLMATTGHLFEEAMARYSTKMDDFKGSFAYRVFVVGECKPISCGELTSLQNSVGDSKEFVFPEIAAPPSQPLAWPLASLHTLLSTDFWWSLQ